MNQKEKAVAFAALHRKGDPVVLYNIWDAGSAKAVAEAGAKALATGSWSVAAAHGFGDGEKVPARLHRANVVADVLGGASSIQCVLRRFQQEGKGVLVYLRDGSAGVPIKSVEGEEGSDALRSQQWREVGLGAQILRDLGVASIVNLEASKAP